MFYRQISEKFDFLFKLSKNFIKILFIFQAKIGHGKIILFLFKSHHFWTYFLYMIRDNNISRPVHDLHDPLRPQKTPCSKYGCRDLQPPGLMPLKYTTRLSIIYRNWNISWCGALHHSTVTSHENNFKNLFFDTLTITTRIIHWAVPPSMLISLRASKMLTFGQCSPVGVLPKFFGIIPPRIV